MFWDSFQSFGRPLLVIGRTVHVSSDAVCPHRTAAYHQSHRSKLHYDIYFCMGGPLFTLLNSVTASSCACKKRTLLQFWAVNRVLLRLVCQQPIKANGIGQVVACSYWRLFSKHSPVGHSFLCRKAAIVEWRETKREVSCFFCKCYI